jgi:acetaldehyde dehydrogenase/alcohol dehydrogenase
MAIVDSELVMSMPAKLTAFSGIDALTHALEAFVSVLSTEYTNAMALESIRILFKYLPLAYREGATNLKARERVHNATCMAGMAFANAFLGICHSMAHKLGAAHHLPHGLANALLISHVVKYNATDAPVKQAAFPQYTYPSVKERYARIADYLHLGGVTLDDKVEALVKAVEGLKKELDIPASIRDAGVPEKAFFADLDALAEEAFDDQCTGANPRYPLIAELKQLYTDAFHGTL